MQCSSATLYRHQDSHFIIAIPSIDFSSRKHKSRNCPFSPLIINSVCTTSSWFKDDAKEDSDVGLADAAAAEEDAEANSIVILDTFAQILSNQLSNKLPDLDKLFG